MRSDEENFCCERGRKMSAKASPGGGNRRNSTCGTSAKMSCLHMCSTTQRLKWPFGDSEEIGFTTFFLFL